MPVINRSYRIYTWSWKRKIDLTLHLHDTRPLKDIHALQVPLGIVNICITPTRTTRRRLTHLSSLFLAISDRIV